jgi:predicted RNA-binding Zn ribbon-like protein
MPVSRQADLQPPNDLELVIDFVNTLDPDDGVDQLASADGLAAWLTAQRLHQPAETEPIREADRQQAIRLREALRTLMLANNGATPDQGATYELERVARSGQLSVHFPADGSALLAPRAEDFAGTLAKVLVPVAEALRDGSWQRVKACRADDCRWGFYDNSRNRSGVWCDMAVCGNRTKVRAYRRRKPGAGRGD